MTAENVDLSVDLAPRNSRHFKLANPVMIASGTFGYDGYGRGITPEMELGLLGAVIPKTVTRRAREGNPEPRWYPPSYREASEAGEPIFLNSIGLTNPGIEDALRCLAPQWDTWNATVVLSMSGETVAQFGEMAAMTRGVEGFQAIELNLSCPNVENGALFAHSPRSTADAVTAVRANTDLPLLVKLAPNVPDITEIARAAVEAGADALTICNTIPAMHIDTESREAGAGGGHRRAVGTRVAPGFPGVSVPHGTGGRRAHRRGWGDIQRGTCRGVHAGRGHGGANRQRQPGEPVESLQGTGRAAGVSGRERYRQRPGAYRVSEAGQQGVGRPIGTIAGTSRS